MALFLRAVHAAVLAFLIASLAGLPALPPTFNDTTYA